MKKYILILMTIFALNVKAQSQPTPKQIEIAKQIKELQNDNKAGKNKAKIIKLMNELRVINKKEQDKKAIKINKQAKILNTDIFS